MHPRATRSATGIDLRECLTLPPFASARVREWPEGSEEFVSWVVTIEWPVEDFVSPHDMVLMTGLGCDAGQMAEMIQLIGRAGAAVVCVSTGPGAIHPELAPAVLQSAAESGVALVELPWRVRFADVSRAVIAALYDEEHEAGGAVSAAFASPLLSTAATGAIADALEHVTGLPAAVLDATGGASGSGVRGAEWLTRPGAASRLAAALHEHPDRVPDAGIATLSRLDAAPARVRLGELGDAVVHPVRAGEQRLGWLVLLSAEGVRPDSVAPALAYAATAAAIELVRSAAGSEVEARGRGELLWEIASESSGYTQELAARAALLGLGVGTEYVVAVGTIGFDGAPGIDSLLELVEIVRRQLTHPASVVAASPGGECLFVLCGREDVGALRSGPLPRQLADAGMTVGVATGRHELSSLAAGVAQARTVRAITRALRGPGSIGRGEDLRAYLMLAPCARDPAVLDGVVEVLGSLERADAARGSELVRTLRAFLDANGNIALAARALFLNRHSVIYRLRRIGEVSGLDTADPEARLALAIALRIREIQQAEEPEPTVG